VQGKGKERHLKSRGEEGAKRGRLSLGKGTSTGDQEERPQGTCKAAWDKILSKKGKSWKKFWFWGKEHK